MYYTVEQELELATLALCDAFLSDAFSDVFSDVFHVSDPAELRLL